MGWRLLLRLYAWAIGSFESRYEFVTKSVSPMLTLVSLIAKARVTYASLKLAIGGFGGARILISSLKNAVRFLLFLADGGTYLPVLPTARC